MAWNFASLGSLTSRGGRFTARRRVPANLQDRVELEVIMRNHLRTALLATAIAIAGIGPVLTPDVAQAQGYSRHSYRNFHRVLARYGDWVYSDRWGEVWIPNVSGDFRPYR